MARLPYVVGIRLLGFTAARWKAAAIAENYISFAQLSASDFGKFLIRRRRL